MWGGYFHRLMSGRIVPTGLEKGKRFVGIGLLPALGPLIVSLRTVMALVGVSLDVNVFSSVQFSPSVVSDSLQSHESQQARPPCPSPTPGVHTNSWILSR